VEVSLSRTDTPEGVRYAAVVRDLTEQRMNFEMLNLYSRALECTTNGVVIADMSLPGQPLFYANPAFCRISGYEAHEVIGRSCRDMRGKDVDQPEFAVLRQAIADSRSAQVVVRNYRKDGSLYFNELSIAPVPEPSGRVRHYVGVINDVTERERSRMAIAERSARLNAVFDLSPDGFVVFDGLGQLVYCNPAFLQMTGWDQGPEVQAMTMAEFDRRFALLCDPTQPAHPVADVAAAPHHGASAVPEVLSLVRPEHRMLARMARSTREDHGETILFFRDITRESEVDRMKSEFLTTAAHELRTPMVSVFGFTELLLRRPVPEERRRDMLETIHRQASLLINMVNELLDLARIEARQGKDLRREPCHLDSLLTEAVGPLLMQTQGGPHQVQLRMAPQHQGARLLVDPEKTNRALTNVLSNAVKYSPQGGCILVETVDGQLHGDAAVGLRVTDQGMGMSPEQLARVFERFYRADPSGNIPGTGLGMSLVKEIVELQGGQVGLHSEAGVGTQVTLWLPLLGAPAPRPVPALSLSNPNAEVS
jgi:PAS domain S-box-containing protein